MAHKYWFEHKKYGWGFVPTTMEGWVATLVLLVLMLIVLHTHGALDGTVTADGTLRLIFDSFVVLSLFTILMKSKVKGGLDWRWGGKKKRKTKRRKRR